MSDALLIPNASVRALADSVALQGYDAVALMREAGIDARGIKQGEDVSLYAFGRFIRLSMAAARDESMGLINAGHLPIGSFRLMVYACIGAADLEKFIHRCGEFYEIVRGAVIKPVLQTRGTQALLTFDVVSDVRGEPIGDVLSRERPDGIAAYMNMWFNLMSWAIAQRIDLTSIQFTFAEAELLARPRSGLLGLPLQFHAECNALVFPQAYLRMAPVSDPQRTRAFIQSLPFSLMTAGDLDDSLTARVRGVIGYDLTRELPTAADVAAQFGLSVSSLRRHLIAEGTSYREIKDDCRKTVALRSLASPDMSVEDVAYASGFEDSGAFFRAFRKWTGMTPNEYRRQMQGEPAA
jgi:AraC-like DNA-binding protein